MVPKRMYSSWYSIELGWGTGEDGYSEQKVQINRTGQVHRREAVHHHGHPAGGGAVASHSGVGGWNTRAAHGQVKSHLK